MSIRVPSEPARVGEVFARWALTVADDSALERTEVIRTGEREPIDGTVRRLIHRRDRWRCQWCNWSPLSVWFATRGRQPQMLQLDHIVPWSAGGSDRSDNLRTLCDVCNEERSNRKADLDLVTVLPVVVICDPCNRDVTGRSEDVPGHNAIDVFCGWAGHNSWTDEPGLAL